MKIICIGRNYVAHAKELHNEVPTEPVVFIKPTSSILPPDHPFILPHFSSNIQYECELILKIGKTGKNIGASEALDFVEEIGLGLDLTARDLQAEMKSKGLPWEIAKSFDGAAVIGDFIPFNPEKVPDYTFDLYKNDEKVQHGNPANMIFSFEEIITFISQFFTLEKGDLIFTGTPSGVGKLEIDDILTGKLQGKEHFKLLIAQ